MAYSRSKIPIPRLHTRSESLSDHTPPQRRRASRACQSCRARKAKCDEGWPACGQCKDSHVQCVYTGGKREERNRRFELLSRKEAEYEAVLSHISLASTDPLSRLAAQTVLEKFSPDQKVLNPPTVPPDVSASTCDPLSSYVIDDAPQQPLAQPIGYIGNPFPSFSQVNDGSHGPVNDLGLGLEASTIGTEPGHRVSSTASMTYLDPNFAFVNDLDAAHFLT
ncbi:transcriptional regulator family: Fungal Specific TF [Paecilomyces variotii]|nr:transcriptional regulator family: Fungal Specific TF [Paecilomyces variotii]KAJ9288159.1 transcriptional regulator family: Fungal Specific TF [Paecilomyces variotii]KAJ9329085.1 transcriptional regulator family: Fungal Specific TF [Paecilomyces variotii]KAJ9335794.1 transcriptional regulator family: Fungal Specific TF [Paecilomyces variotii]